MLPFFGNGVFGNTPMLCYQFDPDPKGSTFEAPGPRWSSPRWAAPWDPIAGVDGRTRGVWGLGEAPPTRPRDGSWGAAAGGDRVATEREATTCSK
jgi:hypothetical protein